MSKKQKPPIKSDMLQPCSQLTGKTSYDYNYISKRSTKPINPDLAQRQANNQEMHQRSKSVKVTLPTIRFLEKKDG